MQHLPSTHNPFYEQVSDIGDMVYIVVDVSHNLRQQPRALTVWWI